MKPISLTAKQFIEELTAHQSPSELQKNQRFITELNNSDTKCLGVRMKTIFDTAKAFTLMPVKEIEKLFTNPYYEVRMGAVCIMDFQAKHKTTSEVGKKALFDLFIKNHNRINNWDMMDRAAPHVIGAYLMDKPRKILYKLAKSKNPWERRTAIVSTAYFIKHGETEDTFNISELLVRDTHEYVQTGVGSWIREAGKKDKHRLLMFLDRFADKMPRIMLRYAIEKLDKKEKEKYRSRS
jgi:3-methyladenine DNA glycosylase AlkD